MTTKPDYRTSLYPTYVSGHQGVLNEDKIRPILVHDVLPLVGSNTQHVIDVGCGQGQLVRLLDEHGFRDVVGIDVSDEQIALAQSLDTHGVVKCDLFDARIRMRESFDCVVALDVVEHFAPDASVGVFGALWDLLRSNGKLILRTPNGCSPYAGKYRYGDLTHGLSYTPTSIAQVASSAGFTDVTTIPVRPTGRGIRKLVRRVGWGIVEPLIKLPIALETGEIRGNVVTQNMMVVCHKQL